MADFSSNVGNFKGVMLCNRPTTVAEASRPQISYRERSGIATTVQSQRPGGAFVSTVATVSLTGINPIRKQFPASKAPKLKSDDVTWRHKRWLADFQQKRALLMQAVKNKAQSQAERNKRVVERAAKKRAQIRSLPWDLTSGAPATSPSPPTPTTTTTNHLASTTPSFAAAPEPTYTASSPPYTAISETQMIDNNVNVTEQMRGTTAAAAATATATAARKQPASGRPAWAYTEEGHADAEEQEVDDLLDFAQNLDFDSFMEDLEVREAVKFVKQRVEDIKYAEDTAEKKAERKAELDGRIQERIDAAAVRKEEERANGDGSAAGSRIPTAIEDRPEWDPSIRLEDDGAPLTAEQLLARDSELRQVHSSRSIRALMETADANVPAKPKKKKIVLPMHAPAAMAPVSYAPPRIVVSMPKYTIANKSVVNEDGTVTRKTTRPSQLAFLYRHPAI
jgi:hypothetical protein